MHVELISYTPNPEKVVACAAKLCYSANNISEISRSLDEKNISKFIKMLVNLGHESPLEHINFTFAVEGISRSLLAQITRHRIASYSVQSQRYVKSNLNEYVVPPEIENISEAKEEFLKIMDEIKKSYDKLTNILTEKYKKNSNLTNVFVEKKAIEDARYVLPNAWCTKIICTFNARSLLNFFKHRCCNRAQWEIKFLACEMLKLVKNVAPHIFENAGPSCLRGNCSEGKMSCGEISNVRNFFENLK